MNLVIGMAIGKVIENYLDELTVTIIDIIKILYKYDPLGKKTDWDCRTVLYTR